MGKTIAGAHDEGRKSVTGIKPADLERAIVTESSVLTPFQFFSAGDAAVRPNGDFQVVMDPGCVSQGKFDLLAVLADVFHGNLVGDGKAEGALAGQVGFRIGKPGVEGQGVNLFAQGLLADRTPDRISAFSCHLGKIRPLPLC